jgi:hypothetical protein
MLKTLQFVLMLFATCAAVELRADVLNFDDLSDNGTGTLIQDPPGGYHGFHWDNFYVMNAQAFTDLQSLGPNGNANGYIGANGYVNGLVSGSNVAFNGFGDPALVRNGLFNFNSAYFNAAWNDGLILTVTGKLAGNIVDVLAIPLGTSGPATKVDFNWKGIDELDFTASGGTHHAGYNGSGAHFVMDNFDVTPLVGDVTLLANTPEPSRLVGLLGLGGVAVALAGIGRLRRRRSTAFVGR